ncbi:hypothetical protein ACVI1K_003703 [Bradyrhizobium sp. USDA 4508]
MPIIPAAGPNTHWYSSLARAPRICAGDARQQDARGIAGQSASPVLRAPLLRIRTWRLTLSASSMSERRAAGSWHRSLSRVLRSGRVLIRLTVCHTATRTVPPTGTGDSPHRALRSPARSMSERFRTETMRRPRDRGGPNIQKRVNRRFGGKNIGAHPVQAGVQSLLRSLLVGKRRRDLHLLIAQFGPLFIFKPPVSYP